ncbi:LysR substrate-binding domain-containing protein [Noviherbaspirillum sp. UKPF54]|uniref:LysR substrate-binding domain-containing protein n=1 Tax=Noviherbaspirillum sp. UKPF54 TaxID=2601898 RepID=UPI0011B1076C|nr:LysR substrate-binding domain-containing protein [Noviherbaspirillum sp. UKPF54]QDZ27238.1 LysR family transcriptional regulator [Noviherbaspirillum sp. UKPF54]
MRRVNFDLDALRSFAVGMELGSFAKAADRLARSTSAVSAQLKKLEDQAGVTLLRKSGRGMALTDAGEVMLGYARRMLELNDEAAMAVGAAGLDGFVRLGLQEDFGEHLLPDVLGRFARSHSGVRIEAKVARNADLVSDMIGGRLDLALTWQGTQDTPYMEKVGRYQLEWIGPAGASPESLRNRSMPLPLVAFDAPCLMRTIATEALDRAGIPWRLTFTSHSLGAVWAAVGAGLGVTVRTRFGLRNNLRTLPAAEFSLPALPKVGLVLHRLEAEPDQTCALLAADLRESVLA